MTNGIAPKSSLPLTRRSFLLWSAALGATTALPGAANASRLRLGFIGLGGRGSAALVSAITMSERADIVALCDIAPKTLSQACRLCGERAPRLSTRADVLLASPDLDAVVLATPTELQLPLAQAACEAGKDILLLRPLPFKAAPLRELAENVTKNGRRVDVCRERLAVLAPASASALAALSPDQIEAIDLHAQFELPAPLPLQELLSQLVDEVEFGLSLLGGTPVIRRFELGGTFSRPGTFADYQLHLESRSQNAIRSLTLKLLARPGHSAVKASQMMLAGNRGRVNLGWRPTPSGNLPDLELFTSPFPAAALGLGSYAQIVDLLLPDRAQQRF